MTINKTSWHCRVYCWWYGHKYNDVPRQSNLCPYMRAVMLWAPMRALFSGFVKIGKAPIGAITIPMLVLLLPELLGYLSYDAKISMWLAYGVLSVIVLGVAAVIGTFALFSSDGYGLGRKIFRPINAKIDETGFIDLLKEYFRSAHDRVCPEVAWQSEKDRAIDDILGVE